MKIKPSANILCEDEPIDVEEFLFRFDEFKDIRSITIDDKEYVVPWEDDEKNYGVNAWQRTNRTDNAIEITILKPREFNK